jgi:SAM-dependent methyltransferase
MYQRLKRLVPRPVRLAFEPLLRRVLYIFYRGDAFRCNICGAGLARFVTMPDDRMCPRCGSLSRNRRLYGLLTSEFLRPGVRMLDFSPSRALFRALKATPGITYISSDFAGEFVADQHYDLTRLEVPDASVDLITCFHVLEHIVNDRAAVAEIQRVLTPGGSALIQTPFRAGEIHEDPTVTTPAGRRAAFGQEDHVRTYSADGLASRLRDVGLAVEVREFADSPDNPEGLTPHEIILVASKIG